MVLMLFFACLIAGISTAAFVALWFWVVRQELYAKQKAVNAARGQLIASKQAYMRARGGPKERPSQEILGRSEHVYKQSIQRYHETLHKPWNRIPAFFLDFRMENVTNQTRQNKNLGGKTI